MSDFLLLQMCYTILKILYRRHLPDDVGDVLEECVLQVGGHRGGHAPVQDAQPPSAS